jgi:hypothetical protein
MLIDFYCWQLDYRILVFPRLVPPQKATNQYSRNSWNKSSGLKSYPISRHDSKSAMKFGVPPLGLTILRRWLRNEKEHGTS